MKISWRFLVGLTLGLILGIALFVGFLYTEVGVPTELTQWTYDISSAKERYAAHTPGPRLLIVAGSSALFGINAQLIQQQTGFSTVNLGTHAGLALDYRFFRIRKVCRPGDTILLALEYESYLDRFAQSSELSDDYILGRDPEYFHGMSFLSKIEMATRIPFARLQKGWKNRRFPPRTTPHPDNLSVYSPITPGIVCIDDNGDEVFNTKAARPSPQRPNMSIVNDSLTVGPRSESTPGFQIVSDFVRWAQAHQITVLTTFPAMIDQREYHGPGTQRAIQMITHFYEVRHVPVIGSADEALLPSDQFFDTVYHMTHEAALARTERLIPELRPYLPIAK